MIRKINYVNNLGTFSGFHWNNQTCDDFNKLNILYGWNYSGKTTLSRLFRCLELKEFHRDYPDLQFKIETNKEYITDKNILENDISIRVYNEDFIDENFKWNDENHRVNPVLILGKESIDLQHRLENKRGDKKRKEEELDKLRKDLKRCMHDFDNFLTNKASEIRKILNITNQKEFDRTSLENRLEKLKDNWEQYILSKEELEKKSTIYKNHRIYEKINKIKIDLKINDLTTKTCNILKKRISVQQIIQKLKDNPALNNWVRQGIELHKNQKQCQFCGGELPSDLFERLNKHFSKDFDELINEIEGLKKEITIYTDNLNLTRVTFPDEERFYEEYKNEYKMKKEKINNILEAAVNESKGFLLEKLEEKRNKPFDIVECIYFDNKGEGIKELLKDINILINRNNEKIEGLSEEKIRLKEQLINHLSAEAVREIGYFERKKEIESLRSNVKSIEMEVGEIGKEIIDIEQSITVANIGAKKINNYLKIFFSDDRLQLKPLEDGTYQVYRAGNIAKNLSTGEKNIIALIYFITKLEEIEFKIDDSIIFIDDPVSNLDSNHIFRVYGFIGERVLKCKQLFITTHNFDFFNLLKNLGKADEKKYYLIKKICTNNDSISKIENLPTILQKFKSEYNYLFSILKEFKDLKDRQNYEYLYFLPNIVRRFTEAYLFSKYPDGKRFKDKCNIFFKECDCEEARKESTLKLLDEYSHEQNPEHVQKFPDINEIEACVDIVLNQIEKKDKDHYDALCSSLTQD